MHLPLIIRIAAAAFALAAAQAVIAPNAIAHAVIIDSVPAVGAVVMPGDVEITLHYNSRIDHQRSRLTLVSSDGTARQVQIAQESAPDVVMGKAANLSPGQYRLRWQVLAIDGHLTRGDIPFSVKAP